MNFKMLCFEVVELVKKYKDQGVVGIDLAGDEPNFPNEMFQEIFEKAHEANLNITIHAGENGDPNSIKTAVENLYAQRIGHGYASLKDESVYNILKDKNIILEVIFTVVSNPVTPNNFVITR